MAELVLYALPKMIAEVCIDEQNRNQPEMVQGLWHMRGVLPQEGAWP